MKPTTLLRLEGLAVLTATIFAYHAFGFNWWLLLGLFLMPDLFMLGYLVNKVFGALIYNLGHTYFLAIPLGVVSWFTDYRLGLSVSFIWIAHIGFDRMLGYGLKHPSGFKDTHLGSLEKK